MHFQEAATADFIISSPRCSLKKQGAGHWLYKADRKTSMFCNGCLGYPSTRLWNSALRCALDQLCFAYGLRI